MASLIPNSAEHWDGRCLFCGAAAGHPCVTVIQNYFRRAPGRVSTWLHNRRDA